MVQQDTKENGVVRVALTGELTIYRAAELRQILQPEIDRGSEIELDLSQVTEIDAAGLQLLVAAKLEAMIRDKHLMMTGHSKPVLEVIDLCDLGGFFGDQIVIYPQGTH